MRDSQEISPASPALERNDTILYLDGVSVSFDGFKALNDLSLYVLKGELRAIIGPNGAGKTTMMDVVTGKTRPDEGQVLFDGLTDLTRFDEARIANISAVPIPAALYLFGSGLIGLVGLARRKSA